MHQASRRPWFVDDGEERIGDAGAAHGAAIGPAPGASGAGCRAGDALQRAGDLLVGDPPAHVGGDRALERGAGAEPGARPAKRGASSSVIAMSAMRLTSASAPASELEDPSGPARSAAITMPATIAPATTIASAQRAHSGGGWKRRRDDSIAGRLVRACTRRARATDRAGGEESDDQMNPALPNPAWLRVGSSPRRLAGLCGRRARDGAGMPCGREIRGHACAGGGRTASRTKEL